MTEERINELEPKILLPIDFNQLAAVSVIKRGCEECSVMVNWATESTLKPGFPANKGENTGTTGNLLTTAMAVMPHKDAEQALKTALILDTPFWPQLPLLSHYADIFHCGARMQYFWPLPGCKFWAGLKGNPYERVFLERDC